MELATSTSDPEPSDSAPTATPAGAQPSERPKPEVPADLERYAREIEETDAYELEATLASDDETAA